MLTFPAGKPTLGRVPRKTSSEDRQREYPGNTQDSSVTLSGPSQLHFVAKGPLPEERESLFHYRVIVILVRKFF